MLTVLLTVSVAFGITFVAIPAIMKVADEKHLFDVPDARKLHNHAIASLGGVGIYIGMLLAVLLTTTAQQSAEIRYFFAAALIIFFLGLKDDILVISPVKKFIGQLGAAAILIHLGGIRLDSLHGFLGIYDLPYFFAIPFTYMTFIVIINAFNLIDGVDGLAGSLGLLTSLLFGSYFYLSGQEVYALLSFALAGSLVAFLIFNFNPAKIFMGDSGSLLLGLINALLVIKFINTTGNASVSLPIGSGSAIGFAFLVVPLLDTLRVFSIRMARGRSPFSPDRNHIHHLLLDRGFNHKQVTLSCVTLNIAFILLAYAGRQLGSTVLILSMMAAFYSVVAALMYLWKPSLRVASTRIFQAIPEPKIASKTKVVALKPEGSVVEQ